MTPEALERLRTEAENRFHSVEVEAEDLRALLDAYAAMEKERDEALAAGRTVVEAADEMRQQWAEIEEGMTNERDAAHAEGVAEERARVVADLRDWEAKCPDFNHDERWLLKTAADRYERGEHDKEGM